MMKRARTDAERQYDAERSKDPERKKALDRYRAAWLAKNKNAANERRRAKAARHRIKAKKLHAEFEGIFGAGGLVHSVVSRQHLTHDQTRFSGPGSRRSAQLERQADAFLLDAIRKKQSEKKRCSEKPKATYQQVPTPSSM